MLLSEDRLLVALLNWFFCDQFYRSILLFVHGLSCAACEVLIHTLACFVTLSICVYNFFSLVCYVWAFPGRSSLYCHSGALLTKYLCYLFAVYG